MICSLNNFQQLVIQLLLKLHRLKTLLGSPHGFDRLVQHHFRARAKSFARDTSDTPNFLNLAVSQRVNTIWTDTILVVSGPAYARLTEQLQSARPAHHDARTRHAKRPRGDV